jgi:hypothetical protein
MPRALVDHRSHSPSYEFLLLVGDFRGSKKRPIFKGVPTAELHTEDVSQVGTCARHFPPNIIIIIFQDEKPSSVDPQRVRARCNWVTARPAVAHEPPAPGGMPWQVAKARVLVIDQFPLGDERVRVIGVEVTWDKSSKLAHSNPLNLTIGQTTATSY